MVEGVLWWGSSPGSLKAQGRVLSCDTGVNTGVLSKCKTVRADRMFHLVLSGEKGDRVVHFTAQNQQVQESWLNDLESIVRVVY